MALLTGCVLTTSREIVLCPGSYRCRNTSRVLLPRQPTSLLLRVARALAGACWKPHISLASQLRRAAIAKAQGQHALNLPWPSQPSSFLPWRCPCLGERHSMEWMDLFRDWALGTGSEAWAWQPPSAALCHALPPGFSSHLGLLAGGQSWAAPESRRARAQ